MKDHKVLRRIKIEVHPKIEVEKDLTAQEMKSMAARRKNERGSKIMTDTRVKDKIITNVIDRAMTGDKATNHIPKASINKTIKSRNMVKDQNQAFTIMVIRIPPCNKKDKSTSKSLDHEVGHLVLGKEAHTVQKR